MCKDITKHFKDYIDENGITAPSGAGMTLNNFDTDGGVIS